MQIFRFGQENGMHITQFNSDFVMSRILQTNQPTQLGCMYLEAGGVIGFHRATCPQLLLVIRGEGWVHGESGKQIRVGTGDAVFWEEGAGHKTWTDSGLTAIAVEADELYPSRFMEVRI